MPYANVGFVRNIDDNVEKDFVVDFPPELPMMRSIEYP